MKRAHLVIALLAPLLLGAHHVHAQTTYKVVGTCGTQTYAAGGFQYPTMDVTGNACANTAAGSGGATAANQVLQLTQETSINTNLTTFNGAQGTGLNPPSGGTGLLGFLSGIYAQSISTNPTGVYIAPSSTAGNGIAAVVSSAAESCHVLKNSAGNFYGASGYVGAAAWIMVFNATSAPVDGAVTPVAWVYSPGAGSWFLNYSPGPPLYLATGITICASSTGPLTKTAYSTNTVFSGQVQ